jgi:hypothetical protein
VADLSHVAVVVVNEAAAAGVACPSPLPAQIAMDTDHDGKVDVGEVIAFWLGERVSS